MRTAATRSGFGPFPGRATGFHRFHNRVFFDDGFFFFNNDFFLFPDRFFFRGCFGCFSPFFFSSGFFFGDPFFFGFPSVVFAPPPPPPPPPVVVESDSGANAANVQLATEVQRLSDEVEDLRAEERARGESGSAEPNTSITAKEPGLPVDFIFRDGRRISARNYAIAGQTLWILDEHTAKKFSVADLDVDATQQANAAKGIEIHIPAPQH